MTRSGRRGPGLALATLAALTFTFNATFYPAAVLAGHTMPNGTGGDCWRAGTPLWCRLSWSSAPAHQVRVHLVDEFSSGQYSWALSYAQIACNNWHNYRLPNGTEPDIQCHWSSVSNDTYVHLTENEALPSGIYGLTFNCNSSATCSGSSFQTMNVWYSYSQFAFANWVSDYVLYDKRTFVFAHEMGHTLGLWHHSGTLMASGSWPSPVPTGPKATDYGTLPPCSGTYTSYGVRCVFDITN